MDVQLKELIDKIKEEGVKTAESRSLEIITEAEKKAASLISDAEKKAAAMADNARQESDKILQSGKDSLQQAGRDLILSLKGEIETIFNTMLKEGISDVLSGDALGTAVNTILTNWKEDASIDVLVPEQDLDAVKKTLQAGFAEKIKAGMEIKPFRDLKAGFRISEKDGSAFYEFSAAELAEILSRFLNQFLSEIITKQ